MDDTSQKRSGLPSKLVTLFVATFTVSCTANSGYAIIAVMKDDFVNHDHPHSGWFAQRV